MFNVYYISVRPSTPFFVVVVVHNSTHSTSSSCCFSAPLTGHEDVFVGFDTLLWERVAKNSSLCAIESLLFHFY